MNDEFRTRLIIALKAAKICIFEVDLKNQLYTYFENAEDIFGISGAQILSEIRSFSELPPSVYQEKVKYYFSYPQDFDVIDKAFQSIFNGQSATYEARMKAGSTAFVWCKVDVTPILEKGVPVKMIGVITDISSLKFQNETLVQEVKFDGFTGLYRKEYFIREVQDYLSQSYRDHALIMLDVDNFKMINDTYGHQQGDRILQEIALQLKNKFEKTSLIGRFGGDEFIVFVKDFVSLTEILPLIQSLTHCLMDSLAITNSIGLAITNEKCRDYEALFLLVDKALYHAKEKKGTFVLLEHLDEKYKLKSSHF